MKNVMDWMVSEGIAKNDFQASAIVNGLKLYELKDDEARKARVRWAFLSFENQRKSQEASDMDIRIEEDGLH